MIGFGAYADTSRLMDDNLRAFKGYSQDIDNLNKQIQSQADEKENVNDLRKIGEEYAIKQGKDLLTKYGSKMYSGKIPFTKTSIEDLDKKAGSVLDDAADKVFSAGKNIPEPVSFKSLNTTKIGNSRLNAGEPLDESGFGDIEEIPTIGSEGNSLAISIQQQKEQLATQGQPKEAELSTEPGDIEMQPVKTQIEMKPMANEAEEASGSLADLGRDAAGDDAAEMAGKTAATAAEEVGEKAGAAEIAETTAQALGLGLDATGVLAPLGALVSLGADIFGLFEAGKTAADFVERDVTHTKVAPTPDLIPQPTGITTLAQKGYAVTPSLDTYDIAHTSIAHGW